MVGRGELEMRIKVCMSGFEKYFVKITPHVHILYCFPVQWDSLGSIAFSVHHCMQNVPFYLICTGSRYRAFTERAPIAKWS